MPKKERPCRLCPSKRYGNVSWCRVHWFARKKEKQEATKAKRLARKLASKKHQESERKKWHKKCWTLMSRWVRYSVADWRGMVECWTCRKMFPVKETNAGHFIHGVLDFDERNLKVQCVQDNLYHSGKLDEYAIRLVQTYGLPWVEKLKADAAQHPGYHDVEELKRIHADLTAKLSTLQ